MKESTKKILKQHRYEKKWRLSTQNRKTFTVCIYNKTLYYNFFFY